VCVLGIPVFSLKTIIDLQRFLQEIDESLSSDKMSLRWLRCTF